MSLNDFILGKDLGKGAFGSVRIATRKKDGKIYAMKSVNIGKLDNKEKEAALNEVRILASLSHPNIIGYKDAFYDERSKSLNIVMEYADDGDISHKIKENLKRRLRFEESTLWEWIIQILEGIKYLHDNKIMHRDLKCANIFLMKNGQLKIGDLNVSKLAKSHMARTQTGTPFYLAPEIWKDTPYDNKCDIWSVGCIIYELCTSRPPFRGTSLKELCRNVMTGYYLPITGYSNDMKEIISYMLKVDPKKRYSIDELLNCEIIKKRIKSIKNEIITQGIQSSQKANLIKTIKLPRNMHDINSALPHNRYNPKETMLDNDPYEKTKNIYMETIRKQNFNPNNVKIEPELMNNYDKNALAQKKYQQQNANNKLDIIEEKPKQPQQQQNKYAYLNKYDNNMKIKNEFANKNMPHLYNVNNNAKNRPASQQVNNNYNRYNNNNINNKKNVSPLNKNKNNKGDFSKGNNKNRYQNMFGDDNINSGINNNQNNKNRPSTNQQDKRAYGNKINNYNRYENNRQKVKPVNQVNQKGWFKKNYPEFKYNQPKRAKNCKVNYGKINYNDYCSKNKIDKGRNYHYLRENGYYNYHNAMNAYRGKQIPGQVNRYGFNAKPNDNNIYQAMQFGKNNGPNIVNIKK